MPSFNAKKLQDMLDRRSAASAGLRDINTRARDAREDRNRLGNTIRLGSQSQGRQAAEYVERLMAMPLDSAANLPKEAVEGFEAVGMRGRYLTGVNYQTWCKYILAAQQQRRLQSQAEAAMERFDAEFAIVENLLHAVRSWGFNMQET